MCFLSDCGSRPETKKLSLKKEIYEIESPQWFILGHLTKHGLECSCYRDDWECERKTGKKQRSHEKKLIKLFSTMKIYTLSVSTHLLLYIKNFILKRKPVNAGTMRKVWCMTFN